MKTFLQLSAIATLTANYITAQPFQNNTLPFENNEITIEKIMAGMVVIGVYLIPTLISRDKKNWIYIFVFNLLTAWTIIGWFISFAWAINARSKSSGAKDSIEETYK